jgi:hypothetical protein
MARKYDHLPASLAPRGLDRRQAAAYIGVSPSMFDQTVKDGHMPPTKRPGSRTIWDIRQLDRAFDGLPSDDYEDGDPFAAVIA